MVKGKGFLKYFERDGAEKDDNRLLEKEDSDDNDGDLFASIVPTSGGPVDSFRTEIMSSSQSLSERLSGTGAIEGGPTKRMSTSMQNVDHVYDTTFEASSPPRQMTLAGAEKEKKKKGIKGLLGVSTHKSKPVAHCGEIVVNRDKLPAGKSKDESGTRNATPKSPPQGQSKTDNKPRFHGMRLSQMLPGKAKPKLLMLDDGSFVQGDSMDDPLEGGAGGGGGLSMGDGTANYDDESDDEYDPLPVSNGAIPQFDPTKAHQVDLNSSNSRKKKTTRRNTRDRSPIKSPVKDGKGGREKSPMRDDRDKGSRTSSAGGKKSRRESTSRGMSSRKLPGSEGAERLEGAQSDRHRVSRKTDSSDKKMRDGSDKKMRDGSDKRARKDSRKTSDGEDAERRKRSDQLRPSTHRMTNRRQYSKSDLGRSSEHATRRRATGTKSDRHGGRRKLMSQRAMSEQHLGGVPGGGRSNLKDKKKEGDITVSLHSKRQSSRHIGNKRTQMVKTRAHSEMDLMKDVFGKDSQPLRKPAVVKQYDVDSLVKTAIVATRNSLQKTDEILKNPEELERLVLTILEDASSQPRPIQSSSIHSLKEDEEDGEDEEVDRGNGDDALAEEDEEDQEESTPEGEYNEENTETIIEEETEEAQEDAKNEYAIPHVISEEEENIDFVDEDEINQREDGGDGNFEQEDEDVDNFNEDDEALDHFDEEGEDNLDEEEEGNLDEEDEGNIDEEDEDDIDEEDEENDVSEGEDVTDEDEEDVIFEGDEEEDENELDEENYDEGVDAIVDDSDVISVSMQYARTLMQLEDLESNPEKGTAGEKSALQDQLSQLQQQFAG